MNQLPVELFVSIIGILLTFTGFVSAFYLTKIDKKLDLSIAKGEQNAMDIAILRVEMSKKQDKQDCFAFHKANI